MLFMVFLIILDVTLLIYWFIRFNPKLGDGNEADSTILKDLQKWSIIDSANNNRDAVRLGEIDKDDNFSSVILPSHYQQN